MFDLRLDEIQLPASERDVDSLISWMIDTLCLHRRRGEATADGGTFSPIHRILKEHLFLDSSKGYETREMADDLSLTPAAIHHHLTRLVSAGMVSSTNGKSWRNYHLTGGSLSCAIQTMASRATMIHKQRFEFLDSIWNRGDNVRLEMELPADDSPSLSIRVKEWGPLEDGESELSRFMADMGLLGERPGKEILSDSISVKLFEMLLNTDNPISIDESAAAIKAPKPRVGRILERFRSTGLIERVARTDRLSSALWSAMNTQYMRRGEDWMLRKGGFERLSIPNSLLKHLKKGKLTPEIVTKEMKKIEPRNQMLLLNLLGGRLPLGHRIVGESVAMLKKKSNENLERILRRVNRVGKILEETIARG